MREQEEHSLIGTLLNLDETVPRKEGLSFLYCIYLCISLKIQIDRQVKSGSSSMIGVLHSVHHLHQEICTAAAAVVVEKCCLSSTKDGSHLSSSAVRQHQQQRPFRARRSKGAPQQQLSIRRRRQRRRRRSSSVQRI